MGLYLVQQRKQTRNGTQYPYYVLRRSVYYSDLGATAQNYVAYIGKEPRLTRSKAERICEEKGVTMDELAAVQGLEIVEDE